MGLRFTFFKQRIFSALRKRILGQYAQGVIYSTQNGLLAAAIDDVAVGKSLGFKGRYDAGEISTLAKLIGKDDVLYVIGTHIGALLVPLGKLGREVIGYEANPDTYQYLETNIHLNKVEHARIFNLAVGDSSRKIEFYQNRSNSGGSKIKPKKDHFWYNYDSPATIEVSMISLDQHARSENLPPADGIIMDIEGAEYFALKGMQETLKKTRFLYIEYIPHHLQNVSSVTNKEFFDLILPHFSSVKFTRSKQEPMNLKSNSSDFLKIMDEFWDKGASDDLLFLK